MAQRRFENPLRSNKRYDLIFVRCEFIFFEKDRVANSWRLAVKRPADTKDRYIHWMRHLLGDGVHGIGEVLDVLGTDSQKSVPLVLVLLLRRVTVERPAEPSLPKP